MTDAVLNLFAILLYQEIFVKKQMTKKKISITDPRMINMGNFIDEMKSAFYNYDCSENNNKVELIKSPGIPDKSLYVRDICEDLDYIITPKTNHNE